MKIMLSEFIEILNEYEGGPKVKNLVIELKKMLNTKGDIQFDLDVLKKMLK